MNMILDTQEANLWVNPTMKAQIDSKANALPAVHITLANAATPALVPAYVTAQAGALNGRDIYYTGTNTATDAMTHTWRVESDGLLIPMMVMSVAGSPFDMSVRTFITTAQVAVATFANFQAFVTANILTYRNKLICWNVGGVDNGVYNYIYSVQNDGVILQINEDSLFDGGGTLKQKATVTMGGFEAEFVGSAGSYTVLPTGHVDALGVDIKYTVFTPTGTIPPVIDFTNARAIKIAITAAQTGNITLAAPIVANPLTATSEKQYTLVLENTSVTARTYTFSAAWLAIAGTALPAISVAAGSRRVLAFRANATNILRLFVDNSAAAVVGFASTFNTQQQPRNTVTAIGATNVANPAFALVANVEEYSITIANGATPLWLTANAATVAAQTTPVVGTEIKLSVINNDTISRRFTFATNYKNNGVNFGTIDVPAGARRVIAFRVVTTTIFDCINDSADAPIRRGAANGQIATWNNVTLQYEPSAPLLVSTGTNTPIQNITLAPSAQSFVATALTPAINNNHIFTITNTSTNTTINPQLLTVLGSDVHITVVNTDTVARIITFAAGYENGTANGFTHTIAAGQKQTFSFKAIVGGAAGTSRLSLDGFIPVVPVLSNLAFLKAYLSSNPTIPTGTDFAITTWTASQDTASAFSGGIFTVPSNGEYDIFCASRMEGVTSSLEELLLFIFVNGSEVARGAFSMSGQTTQTGNDYPYAQVAGTFTLTQGQTVQIRVRHDQGVNTTLNIADEITYLNISQRADKTVIDPQSLPAAPQANWVDGDFGIWNSANNRFQPATLTQVTGAAVASTLTQQIGVGFAVAWAVNTLTSAPTATPNLNLNFASYTQLGSLRFYRLRFYFDNDFPITFSVNGAKDVVSVAGNASTITTDLNNRKTSIRRTDVNTIAIDRDDDNNAEMYADITFTAIM